ncbi:unnamed protein product [Ilex paraguariensis]|uniref:Uncharacterized protein n=1 Tax=Ilex paraguariensis TaxID=185542 RepID=A0ABC8T0C5_9AQUA
MPVTRRRHSNGTIFPNCTDTKDCSPSAKRCHLAAVPLLKTCNHKSMLIIYLPFNNKDITTRLIKRKKATTKIWSLVTPNSITRSQKLVLVSLHRNCDVLNKILANIPNCQCS